MVDSNEGQDQEPMTPPDTTTETTDTMADVSVPEGLREVDPEKMRQIREKMAEFLTKRGQTISGSEDPDSPPQVGGLEGDKPVGATISGTDVDWSEYDLPYSVRHLYPKAQLRETPQGVKWVALLQEFYSTERDAKSHGKRVNIPGANDKSATEPLNLGEYLTEMVNGPDGWSIAAILPGNLGKGSVILQKQTPYILPDPLPLKKAEEIEAPKSGELTEIENAALAFAEEEGLTPPEVVSEDVSEETLSQVEIDFAAAEIAAAEDFARRALPRGAVEVEEGTGAIPMRAENAVAAALARNVGETVAPPVPTGIQPPAAERDTGAGGEQFDGAAGIENVRAGMRNLLDNDSLPNA